MAKIRAMMAEDSRRLLVDLDHLRAFNLAKQCVGWVVQRANARW